jgi:hypothetical protein
VEIGGIPQPTFLPGIHAESGILRVDPRKAATEEKVSSDKFKR